MNFEISEHEILDYILLYKKLSRALAPFIVSNKHFFENKVVYDIGSNIGVFAKLIHKYVGNYKELHLFEPCKLHLEFSRLLLSEMPNIHFNNFGLGANECLLPLYKTHKPSGWNTFLEEDPQQPDGFYNSMQIENCLIRKLDSYNGPKCDFIKIDVEGFECYVLEGGMNFISSCKPILYIEVGWGTLHPRWNSHNKYIYRRLFDEVGYKKIEFSDYTQDVLFSPL